MLHRVYWEVRARVVVVALIDTLKISTIEAGLAQALELAKSEGQLPVHLILDVSGTTGVSTEFYQLNNLRALFQSSVNEPSFDSVVVIDPAPQRLVQAMANVAMQMVKRQIHICASFDEAMKYLTEKEPTLAKT
jgi:hypothetical protein